MSKRLSTSSHVRGILLGKAFSSEANIPPGVTPATREFLDEQPPAVLNPAGPHAVIGHVFGAIDAAAFPDSTAVLDHFYVVPGTTDSPDIYCLSRRLVDPRLADGMHSVLDFVHSLDLVGQLSPGRVCNEFDLERSYSFKHPAGRRVHVFGNEFPGSQTIAEVSSAYNSQSKRAG